MWTIVLIVLIVASIVSKVWRAITLITFTGYNLYKLWGLRKDTTEIEKVIFINGGCVVIGLLLIWSYLL